MNPTLAVALLVVAGSACGEAKGSARPPRTLRVSAPYGLSEFIPGPNPSGSTAYALDLVYENLKGNARVVERKGRLVILEREPSSAFTVDELARSLRFAGCRGASVDATGRIVAVFESERAAAHFGDPKEGDDAAFALGPFELVSQTHGLVRLRARKSAGVDVIELVEVSLDEQWKRLHAHALDVVPNIPSMYKEQFLGMTSVRVVDYKHTSDMALIFNTRSSEVADVHVRRRIAAAIDAKAVARIACGSADCVAGWRHPFALTEADLRTRLPSHLELLYLDTHDGLRRAAQVLAIQLETIGVRLIPRPLAIEELFRLMHRGQFHLMIAPLPLDITGYERFTTAMVGSVSQSRYSNPEYDRAVAARRLDEARRILSRDVPALPLFEVRLFAALNTTVCGEVKAPWSVSWRWLAELYFCEDERR